MRDHVVLVLLLDGYFLWFENFFENFARIFEAESDKRAKISRYPDLIKGRFLKSCKTFTLNRICSLLALYMVHQQPPLQLLSISAFGQSCLSWQL